MESNTPLKPEELLQAETFEHNGLTLNYRIYRPEALTPGEKVPLITFLHGAGERGTDNVVQLVHAIPSILSYLKRKQIKAVLFVPQCPLEMQWVNVPWSEDAHTMPLEPSLPLQAVRARLAQLLTEEAIDLSRIYITGISMGGFGTWDLISRDPDLFAAALPVCGGGDTTQAPRLVKLPIRTLHGDADTVVKPIRSRSMVAALREAGGEPIYTELPDVGHDAWSPTYADDEVLEWLFAQQKLPA